MSATILYDADILTMNPDRPRAWGIRIEDGLITDIIPSCVEMYTEGIDRISAKGRMIVPGFNDCHMHILPYGLDLSKADLSPDAGVHDVPALTRVLISWADSNPQSE